MTVTVSSPVTGGAQTGFTTPSITLTTDVAPSINGKQYAATAVSGMPSVDVHSVKTFYSYGDAAGFYEDVTRT
jgi:hypothetical protein